MELARLVVTSGFLLYLIVLLEQSVFVESAVVLLLSCVHLVQLATQLLLLNFLLVFENPAQFV